MSLVVDKRWLVGCCVLVLASVSVSAQTAGPSVTPIELYHRVSARLLDDWRRMPHYTCVQDISRRYFRSDLKSAPSCQAILDQRAEHKRPLPLVISDRLELEVALADHREVHSWPGESFVSEEDEIHDLLGNGVFGSGDFAAFIGAVFGGAAKVTYQRELIVDRRPLYEYSFQVSNNNSRYEVKSATGPVITGYSGSFLLDPKVEDLVRLSVRTAQLPMSTASCQAIHEIEYGRSEIHGMRVLIPRKTDMRVIFRTGDESATETSYSSCRQFGTTSRLLLDADATAPSKQAEVREHGALAPAASAFPPGIKFKCQFATPIDSETPAGRLIEGVLRTPIRDKDRTILAPRGARVRGRIVRLARHFGPYDYFELAVRLQSVAVGGVERPLSARLSDQPLGPSPPIAQVGYDPSHYPRAMESLTNLLASSGEFFFVQEHLHVKDWDSEWVTQAPEPKKEVEKETQIAQDRPVANPATSPEAAAVPEKPASETSLEAAPTQAGVSLAARTPLQNEDQKMPRPPPATQQKLPDFRLRIESNLVLVRVVVRDSQGNPIRNLKKEDFELSDNRKRMDIAQFEMVSSPQVSPAPAAITSGQTSPASVSSAAHPSFLALYFDDLNTSDADMIDARDSAERYLRRGLLANEQVAIFTSNGPLTTFTADPKQIQEALAKLHASPRRLNRGHDCPQLTDYQAEQINKFQDDYSIDAWKAAIAEVNARCPLPSASPAAPPLAEPIYSLIKMVARQAIDQAQILARSNLQRLEQVVDYLAQFPGQRTVVLVSPGFLSESEQAQLERIIDRALREQVVVSALDPKGLPLLMREMDITRSYTPTADSGAASATHNVDFMREAAATEVMMELADGTGGKFFHNNNDLQAGFRAVSGSTTYYMLAFVPGEFDGKFHQLRVKLTHSKGDIQARRGYLAVENAVETAGAQPSGSESKSAVKDDLQRMMSSREELHDLTIAVSTEVVPSSEQTRDLNVVVRLDLASVPFRKEGDRNLNTVIFLAGIYDNDGKWVNGEKKQFDLKLPNSELKDMQARGVGVRNTFKLKPGKYLLREVVLDTEDHRIAALNRTLDIP